MMRVRHAAVLRSASAIKELRLAFAAERINAGAAGKCIVAGHGYPGPGRALAEFVHPAWRDAGTSGNLRGSQRAPVVASEQATRPRR